MVDEVLLGDEQVEQVEHEQLRALAERSSGCRYAVGVALTMHASAARASGESGSLVIATVNAPDALATHEHLDRLAGPAALEMPIATARSVRIAALARPLWISPQAWALTPMR